MNNYLLHDKLAVKVRKKSELDLVPTPSNLVLSILDLFPQEVFCNSNLKWANVFAKNGDFEACLFYKLNESLKSKIPNDQERAKHIVENMLYSYCADEEIAKHIKCSLLRVVLDDPEATNNFLVKDFLKDWTMPKFDIIIGNPPYQENNGGGTGSSADPIYQKYVEKAIKSNAQYVSMVIPAKWYNKAGKSSEIKLLQTLAKTNNVSKLVEHTNGAKEYFNLTFMGGVCYFLFDRKHNSNLVDHTIIDTNNVAVTKQSVFGETDHPIHKKFDLKCKSYVSDTMLARLPYNITTTHSDFSDSTKNSYPCLFSDRGKRFYQLIDKGSITKNCNTISSYKVCIAKANGDDKCTPKPQIVSPGEVVSETFLVLFYSKSLDECLSFISYMKTKVFQFCFANMKQTQNISTKTFSKVVNIPYDKTYDDEIIYSHFDLTKDDIEFIETFISTTKTMQKFFPSDFEAPILKYQ